MKHLKTIALALLITFSAAVSAQSKSVNVEKSTINWVGKKVTGEHSGTIKVKIGALTFKKKNLTGGNIIVDMTSINTTDLEGTAKQNLDGHLKADDFFGTDKFPLANLVFKKVTPKSKGVYTVVADMTIKGITESVTFDLVTNAVSATTSLKIDRTKYGIKYGSGSFFDNLGDKTIANEFELKVALVY